MNTPLNEESHRIPLERAVQMTTLYRQQKDNILKEEYAGKNKLPISETFKKEAVERLLAQPDCSAVRIYYSMDENLDLHAILVGVNSNDQDILPSTSASVSQASDTTSEDNLDEEVGEDEQGEILEESYRCPPNCGEPSPLNP